MNQYLRLRQICLATDSLQASEEDLTEIFGVQLGHRDPKVSVYGIQNAIFPFGISFIELVEPLQDGAVTRFIDRGASRGAYMAIFNCSDPHRRKQHILDLGLRLAAEISLPDFYGVQLHPRDGRATMVEFDNTPGEIELHGPYFAAGGSNWTSAICLEKTRGISEVVLESPHHIDLAQHWERILECPLKSEIDELFIDVDLCRINFRNGPVELLRTVTVDVTDIPATLKRAKSRGFKVTDRSILDICGVNFLLISTTNTQ